MKQSQQRKVPNIWKSQEEKQTAKEKLDAHFFLLVMFAGLREKLQRTLVSR